MTTLHSRPRVVLKFNASVTAPLTYHKEYAESDFQKLYPEWNDLKKAFPEVIFQPFFGTIEKELLVRLQTKLGQMAGGTDPEFTSFYALFVPDSAGAEVPKGVVNWITARWDQPDVAGTVWSKSKLEAFYVENGPVPPPSPLHPENEPIYGYQEYHSAAPFGIDTEYVWSLGVHGEGVGFADMESGWHLDHQDLPHPLQVVAGTNQAGTLLGGVDVGWDWHGTSVLGIVVGAVNQKGGAGIAPHAETRLSAQWDTDGFWNPAAAIVSLLPDPQSGNNLPGRQLSAGDVLLLETAVTWSMNDQEASDKHSIAPIEALTAVFHAIRAATDLGIIVVAPAGTSFAPGLDGYNNPISTARDLDFFKNQQGRHIFKKKTKEFQDSGAIIVGAATAGDHHRLPVSTFGSRIDCYGWGTNFEVPGWSPLFPPTDANKKKSAYTTFGGTSGAAAIVAGAAVLLQSWAKAQGMLLDPSYMRELLARPDLNTPSKHPEQDKIGVMPNLKKIIKFLGSQAKLAKAPASELEIVSFLEGVIEDGGGIGLLPGGKGVPIGPLGPPDGPLSTLSGDKRDILVGLMMTQLAPHLGTEASRRIGEKAGLGKMQAAIERIAKGAR
jgi:hypothetical protein